MSLQLITVALIALAFGGKGSPSGLVIVITSNYTPHSPVWVRIVPEFKFQVKVN
jgi:hypothetical protein